MFLFLVLGEHMEVYLKKYWLFLFVKEKLLDFYYIR